MVSGILGLALFFLWPVAWIGSVLALVFGLVARSRIRERGGRGEGFSIAGIVLGWVGIAVWVLVLGLIVAVFALGTWVSSFFVDTCGAFAANGTSTVTCT